MISPPGALAPHLVDLIQEWQNATDMLREYADPPTQQALLAWQSLVSTFSFSLQLDEDINHLRTTLRQLHTIQDMHNLFQQMNCTLRFDAQETVRIPTMVLQHFSSSTARLSLLWMTMPILHRVATTMMENTQVPLDQKACTLPQIHSLFARGVQLLQEVRAARHPSHSSEASHGLFLHTVQTNMEAAGLDGLRKWGITLPSSARVSHEIYEPAIIAILYPHLCERYLGGWTIGQPVLSPVEGPPSGPRYMQLSQSVEWKFSRGNEVADDVSVQTYRDIYAVVLDQLAQLDIGANEMEGLLVMCNRTEVLGVLTTYPSHLLPESKDNGQPIAVKVDTVVRVAGATCRHGLLFQTYKGFLSGSFVSASEADAEETALRANVGFTRATRSMTMLSPKDMTGLPGAFQVLATYLHGVQTVTKDSQDNVIIIGNVSKAVYTPAEVREKLSQRELYVNMPPLSLLELSYKQEQPSEIVAQHSRVTRREPSAVPTDFDPGSGRATRLRLILAHRKDVQHWTNYSIKTYQHPAWPGGTFRHELLWGYAVDGSAAPRYVVLPTESGWELTRPGGNMQRGNFIGEYDSLSLIHFYDAWRLQPVLTTLGRGMGSPIPWREQGEVDSRGSGGTLNCEHAAQGSCCQAPVPNEP